ncbi:DUF3558 domain-containing protein [Nocardia halotolerans]|uniref:DUF3558 domain-containing protein n=1 Tax=Nocardia halotolerans TaxID=1755878 RepID=A0ABV8VH66_9NOCA
MVAGAVVGAVVGCDDDSSGKPVATSSAAAPVLWDPCSEISDEVIRAAGADPATEESGIGGVHQSGWEMCTWMGDTYSVAVFSTGRTVAEFEQKPGQVDFQDVTIGGRAGRQFRVEGASKDLRCDVLFAARQGVVQISILNRASLTGIDGPCLSAERAGEVLVPTFPI